VFEVLFFEEVLFFQVLFAVLELVYIYEVDLDEFQLVGLDFLAEEGDGLCEVVDLLLVGLVF
jgi:hypothetical protein